MGDGRAYNFLDEDERYKAKIDDLTEEQAISHFTLRWRTLITLEEEKRTSSFHVVSQHHHLLLLFVFFIQEEALQTCLGASNRCSSCRSRQSLKKEEQVLLVSSSNEFHSRWYGFIWSRHKISGPIGSRVNIPSMTKLQGLRVCPYLVDQTD